MDVLASTASVSPVRLARVALACCAVGVLALAGCGQRDESPAPLPELPSTSGRRPAAGDLESDDLAAAQQGSPPPPAREDPAERAMQTPLAQLEARVHELERAASAAAGTAEQVQKLSEAAILARVVARREHDGTWLATARRALRVASSHRSVAGACEAGIALARLEAADAGDLRAAFVAATRVTRRFVPSGSASTCVHEAERMLLVLASARPSDGDLESALAEFHDDEDDELAEAADEAGESAGAEAAAEGSQRDVGEQLAEWAAGRSDVGPAASLDGVDVFAGAAGAEGRRSARVVLKFDHVVLFSRSELAAEGDLPRRLVLAFANARAMPTVRAATGVDAGGLRRVRVAAGEGSELRVALDLDDDAEPRLFFLGDPYRVVVDVEKVASRPAPVARHGAARPLRLVVIDPGHGGRDTGARNGAGLRESQIVLDLARRIRTKLVERSPGTRVLLTRDSDDFVSLEQRAAIANVVGADAFLSVHVNASEDPAEHGGVTTFVLDTTHDRQAARLAAAENGTSESEVTSLQTVIASLHRTEQVGGSRELARLVQRGALAGGRNVLPTLVDRGVRSALFYVLVGARMPAVLLEASFLSRPDEARALGSAQYRQAIADGVVEGLVRYARGE